MERFLKHKNKLAIFLITVTIARILLMFIQTGISVYDLLDSLIPIGGAALLLRMKPRKIED